MRFGGWGWVFITTALPTCSPPAPATSPDPTTMECLGPNPDYDTFVTVNTVDLMNAELNKNKIALNDYFIIKPP